MRFLSDFFNSLFLKTMFFFCILFFLSFSKQCFIFCHFCFFYKIFGLILQLEWTSTHQCTSWTVLSSGWAGWLEWTSSHQCTSWGWGSWSRFGDEPKTHPPCPKFFFFPSLLRPKNFPSYLPPSHLPPPSYLHLPPPTSHSIARPRELLEREKRGSRVQLERERELQSA